MVVPAQRGVNCRPVSLLGSANLVRPRLCLDGPSNIASRHRPEATAVTRACTPRKSQGTTIRLQGSKASELGGVLLWARRVPAREGMAGEKVCTFEALRATLEEEE